MGTITTTGIVLEKEYPENIMKLINAFFEALPRNYLSMDEYEEYDEDGKEYPMIRIFSYPSVDEDGDANGAADVECLIDCEGTWEVRGFLPISPDDPTLLEGHKISYPCEGHTEDEVLEVAVKMIYAATEYRQW